MAAAAASAALDPTNSSKNTLKLENVAFPSPSIAYCPISLMLLPLLTEPTFVDREA